jgi:beta-lactamase regulating signal transducer with metallopeptidase domain
LSFFPNTEWIAAMAFERMLYCLTGGMALAAVIAIALRMLPGRNSRTRFALWFSTLLAVAVMPMMSVGPWARSASSAGTPPPQHAVITLRASWAEYIVVAWAAVALAGLARVCVGMWHLHRMRRGCVPIDAGLLTPASQARIAEAGKRRKVAVLVSPEAEVPAAIGFVHPAIVIPAWLADEGAATELEYVLLHELAHLERWDDWSNLAQKLIKAVLFFHPAVWWIERKLTLDREMACDDAVLAQCDSPRIYAECLARVAEKRFVRRQMALAQAAVDRMKQLSRRVARILSSDGTESTRLWKPAVPMVVGLAAICAVSALRTPELVRVTGPQTAVTTVGAANLQIPLEKSGADPVMSERPAAANAAARIVPARAPQRAQSPAQERAWPAMLKTNRVQTSLAKQRQPDAPLRAETQRTIQAPSKAASAFLLTSFHAAGVKENNEIPADAVVVFTTQRIVSTGAGTWQISTWEIHFVLPASRPARPVPRKT